MQAMSKRGKIKNAAMRAACLFLAVFSVINFSRTAVFADCPDGVPDTDPPSCISSDDLVDINSKTGHDPMYDKHATACGVSGAVSTNPATNTTPVEVGGGSTLNLTPAQVTNIKTVIAVSKALGITRRGAEIGLMTARQESHYKDLKNTGISQDLQNAALAANGLTDQGTGGDHDSLGIMQQRISTGWSTYSNSNSDPKAIQQVLNPAYAAEAFFGIPKGVDIQYPTPTTNPGAVTKGLQNKVPDYDTTNSLTLAAQKVRFRGAIMPRDAGAVH